MASERGVQTECELPIKERYMRVNERSPKSLKDKLVSFVLGRLIIRQHKRFKHTHTHTHTVRRNVCSCH